MCVHLTVPEWDEDLVNIAMTEFVPYFFTVKR